MKSILLIQALILTLALSAQQTDSLRIKASDPTQLYTFVEGYGGLNFVGNNNSAPTALDTWELGFRGNWAIKEKFKIGVYLPMSNNTGLPRVFDDISVDLAYQIHNNSGIYNATVIGAGFTSPSQYDLYFEINPQTDIALYPNSSSFYRLYINYTGALQVSEKLAVYPGIEYFKRIYYHDPGIALPRPPQDYSRVDANGFRFSSMVSFQLNAKSFLQGNFSYATETWNGKWGAELWNEYLSGVSQQRLSGFIKYQYAITPSAQAYANVQYNNLDFNDGLARTASMGGGLKQLLGLQLGFIYYIH